MSRRPLFLSTTLALTLAAGTAFAAGTLFPAPAPLNGVQLSFSAAALDGTVRPKPAPGRRSTDYPVTRNAPSSDLQVLPPIMQSRARIAPTAGLTGTTPVASRDDRLQMNSYWSIGAFR